MKLLVRKADDPTQFLVEVFLNGETDRPEWGLFEEAWDLRALPEEAEAYAEQFGGEVVRFGAGGVSS